MRVATALIAVLLFTTAAHAQQAPCAPQAYSYDAYKPSDLAVMREYAGVVLAQAPLSTLLRLDPYVPSQAELLRQLGRGIPLWPAYPWYSYPQLQVMPDCAPAPEQPPPTASAAPMTRFADMLSALDRERTAPGTTSGVARPSRSRGIERTIGVSLSYDGRTWTSAGAAVPLADGDFSPVGESGGVTVYRRTGAKDNLIYVPTTPGMVAPFRTTP